MRSKKQIERLAEVVSTVPFPQAAHQRFDNFQSYLRDVLDDNGLGRSWEWDPVGQKFHAQWSRRGLGLEVHGCGWVVPTYTMNVELDPARPLMDEIARLVAAHANFQTFTATAGVAIVHLGAKKSA